MVVASMEGVLVTLQVSKVIDFKAPPFAIYREPARAGSLACILECHKHCISIFAFTNLVRAKMPDESIVGRGHTPLIFYSLYKQLIVIHNGIFRYVANGLG